MTDGANYCSRCHCENPYDANHCIHCGAQLSKIRPQCESCSTSAPYGSNFCPECGASFLTSHNDSGSEPEGIDESDQIDSGEYRQVTVLFCDMVKSTKWVHDLGAEAYRQVNFQYREICAPIVTKFDGYISRFMGDGFIALFGYPGAHEDDAQRATRAGLEITHAIARSSFPIDGQVAINIEARVGIATGRVVSSEVDHEGIPKELTVVGETPNLASRIQEFADPNTVLVNSTTQRLIQNSIQTSSIGRFSLKGFPNAEELHKAVRIKPPLSNDSEIGQRSASPLIGRDYELQVLRDCWQHVQQGRGQIVLIRGDAGIGKSRLVQEFHTSLQKPYTCFEFRCSTYFSNSALYPIIERIRQLCQLSEQDRTKDIRNKLEKYCKPYLSYPEQLSELVGLLDLSGSEFPVHPVLRSQPLDALVSLFVSYAEVEKLVLIIEDLHWIDPSTETMLARIVNQIAMVPILVMVTARPEYQVGWLSKSYATQLTPAHLRPSEAEEMIEHLTRLTPIPQNARAKLAYKTDGVPLYVEELTRAVIEAATHSSEMQTDMHNIEDSNEVDTVLEFSSKLFQIPETLRDSFMERLDRLGPSKNLAHLASVLGRNFSFEHIQAASDLATDELQSQLERLVESELLHQKGVPPKSTYQFKHSLIQDAAYDSILNTNRRVYHERIAKRLAASFPDLDRAHPELVARHFVLAGKSGKSVARWSKAAQYALRRGTGLEAIAHTTEGMNHIESAPFGERADLELELSITYAVALSATEGFSVPLVNKAFEKAHELCKTNDSSLAQLFPVLQGRQQVFLLGGSLIKARELGEKLVEIAYESDGMFDRRAEAIRCLGWTQFCLGDFSSARDNIETALTLYDKAKVEEVTRQVVVDAGGTGMANLGWICWFLGDAPEAISNALRSIEHAREIDHPFTLAYTLCVTAAMYQFRKEPENVARYAVEAVSIANAHGFKYWAGWGGSLEGWADFMLDRHEQGLKKLHEGIKIYRETSSTLLAPYIFSLLAECQIEIGSFDNALATLDEANQICAKYEINFYLAEIYRLTADANWHKGKLEVARECSEDALKVATAQGSLNLALRVLVFSLRKSLHKDKPSVLHDQLSKILEAMADGADPRDASAAQTLQMQYHRDRVQSPTT